MCKHIYVLICRVNHNEILKLQQYKKNSFYKYFGQPNCCNEYLYRYLCSSYLKQCLDFFGMKIIKQVLLNQLTYQRQYSGPASELRLCERRAVEVLLSFFRSQVQFQNISWHGTGYRHLKHFITIIITTYEYEICKLI